MAFTGDRIILLCVKDVKDYTYTYFEQSKMYKAVIMSSYIKIYGDEYDLTCSKNYANQYFRRVFYSNLKWNEKQ